MEVLYSENKAELLQNIARIENDKLVKSVIILMTDDGVCTPDFMNPVLKSISKSIIGGVFQEIIVDSVRKDVGAIILPLNFYLQSEVFDFQDTEFESFEKVKTVFSENLPTKASVFIFEDAFVKGKTAFVENIFNYFGFNYTYVGAGCGSYSFKSFPCVIHNTGVYANAAVIGMTEENISIGVAHGWESISNPMKVTESDASVVKSINWEPAFTTYKKIVEEHSGRIFDEFNFLDIVKSYPIGLVKIDGEMVVRDPISQEDGVMQFIDNIDNGQYICVLHGDTNLLLNGAQDARNKCNATFAHDKNAKGYVFCIDCFSRVKFLEEDFVKELKIICGTQSVYGALTFGEIANEGDSYLEIYNKTVIVAKWEQKI